MTREITVHVDDPAQQLTLYGAGARVHLERASTQTGTFAHLDAQAIDADHETYVFADTTGSITDWYRSYLTTANDTNPSEPSTPRQEQTQRYLSVSEFREHANSALPDAAIQRLLDANTVAIDTRLGPPGERTERHDGGGSYLPLDRPLGSVTEVKEVIWSTTTTLAENDWLERGDRYLQRLATGSHPASLWRGRVEVTYTPLDDTAERIRLLVALTKLDLAYSGLASQSIGDYSETQQGDYQAAREDVFGSYSGTVLFA